MKPKKVHCMIFPYWLLLMLPIYWWIPLIQDILAVLLCFTLFRIRDRKLMLKTLPALFLGRSLIWTAGNALLLAVVWSLDTLRLHVLPGQNLPLRDFTSAIYDGPIHHPLALLFVILVMLACGYAQYRFVRSAILGGMAYQLPLDEQQQQRFALLMALITLPFVYLIGSHIPFFPTCG